jgi:Fe-S-cluster containining protein
VKTFPCTSCGLCCKLVGFILDKQSEISDPIIAKVIADFPYKTINGVCEMLQPNNLCAVYDNRPDMCNIDTMSKLLGIADLNAYFKLNAQICNSWIQLHKLDSSYLINLNQFNSI